MNHIRQFSSVAALVADCDKPCRRSTHEAKRIEIRDRRMGADFYGVEGTMETISSLLRTGWTDGADKLSTLVDGLSASLPRAVGIRRQKTRAAFGNELDIHRTNSGRFDVAWSSSKRALRPSTNIISVVVDLGAGFRVSADELFWRGAAAIVLANVLEPAGYSVELVAAYSTKIKSGDVVTVSTVVKPRGVRASSATVAASVCLAGFFRTFGFIQVLKGGDDLKTTVDKRIGHAQPATDHYPVSDRVMTLHTGNELFSEHAAREWLNKSLSLFAMNKE